MATFHANLVQSFKNFKNKYIGNTSIADIGDGTLTSAVSTINQHLSKHTADNGTVIFNGIGTVPSQYVCPSDGYIWANLESNVFARFRINSKMPTNFYHPSNATSTAVPVYVRKGTVIDDIAINSDSGSSILYFFALE